MPKISVTFPNIHCNQITTPRDASDQIYLVAIASAALKPVGNDPPRTVECNAVVSEWDPGVQPGNNFRPVLPGGRRDVVFNVPDEATHVTVSVALAERDDGDTWEKLHTNPRTEFKTLDTWKEVKAAVPDDPTSPIAWARKVAELLATLISGWLEDDLIAVQSFELDLTKRGATDFRHYVGSGGDYVVTIEWRTLA